MKKQPFGIYLIKEGRGFEPLKAVLPLDGTRGFVIGEDWEVKALGDVIREYLNTGKYVGEIDVWNEQLGADWLTVDEAFDLVKQSGVFVPIRTIRWAASNGFIRGAVKKGRDWRFPKMTFLYWLENRPKRGRKKKVKSE